MLKITRALFVILFLLTKLTYIVDSDQRNKKLAWHSILDRNTAGSIIWFLKTTIRTYPGYHVYRMLLLCNCSVVKPSLMSYFMNPGEANQISYFRSENLLCDRRPKAANDKSSPVSGVCLCLLKTLRDLSPSSPLCQDDMLSFQASRWPFVCNDLLIFFSPPLA